MTFSQLMAPVLPFVTEVMYQNLVRNVFEGAYESIHHTDWPVADEAAIDEKLVYQMDLARRVAETYYASREALGFPGLSNGQEGKKHDG